MRERGGHPLLSKHCSTPLSNSACLFAINEATDCSPYASSALSEQSALPRGENPCITSIIEIFLVSLLGKYAQPTITTAMHTAKILLLKITPDKDFAFMHLSLFASKSVSCRHCNADLLCFASKNLAAKSIQYTTPCVPRRLPPPREHFLI